jgi:two-component system CheB/CheR fusion protein
MSTDPSPLRAAATLRIASLTKREREVMDLVVAGYLNKEIASHLGINQRTVEAHRAAVIKKTAAFSLSDLVRMEIMTHGD